MAHEARLERLPPWKTYRSELPRRTNKVAGRGEIQQEHSRNPCLDLERRLASTEGSPEIP
jgi:hypothetical protein